MKLAIAVLISALAVSGQAATFTVTTNADSGPGSLRQAVLDANASPGGTDTIVFAIGTGPQTIALLSPIVVTGPVIFNGTTQPITITFTTNALRFDSGAEGSEVRSLTFTTSTAGANAIWINTADSIRVRNSRITGGGVGIRIETAENVIGGATAADANTISGTGTAVLVSGNDSVIASNALSGNTTAVLVEDSQGSVIRSNVITSNQTGILVTANVTRTWISSNSIYDNTSLGIDLSATASPDGVTPNDPLDPDLGGNFLQNTPVLTSVTIVGSQVTITGTLNSTPSTTFELEFFASASGDEGQQFLGTTSVTTDASGNASFTAVLTATPVGPVITATVMNSSVIALEHRSTSEFSNPVSAAADEAAVPMLDARALALLAALLALIAMRAVR